MLKNSTKITSLLVAAATMATMAPAMAADSKKIAEKDGTIYKAVAYKDSKFYVDGDDIESVNDNDGVYWLNGGKYSDVDDVKSGASLYGTYSDKYIEVEDGDNYVDITTGKVTDDFLRGDDREDAATALKKKIRKDDSERYTLESRTTQAQIDVKETVESETEIWEVPAAPFTKSYYQVKHYELDNKDYNERVLDANGNPAKYATIYTDGDGKYVDADYDLGKVNIIVNRNTTDTSVSYEEQLKARFEIDPEESTNLTEAITFEHVDEKDSKDDEVKYTVAIEHVATLTSDEKYIYRLAALHVSAKAHGTVVTPDAVCFGSVKNPVKVNATVVNGQKKYYVVQKISKEQGDDKEDAKLPKTTETYLNCERKDFRKKKDAVSTNPVKKDGDKVKPDNDRTLFVADNTEVDGVELDSTDVYNEEFRDRGQNNIAFTVSDGKITRYQTAWENSFDTGSDSNDQSSAADGENDKFIVRTVSLKSSNGLYYTDGSKNDEDFEEEDEFATCIDNSGNLWKLDSGKIYKYKNDGDYELKYKCDGGFNEISVYDDDNLIVYNEDDDTYAILGGESSTGKYEVEDENKTETTTTAQVGWYTNADGSWSYGNADGTKAIGWLQSPTSGLWYYMDANGIMMSNGWVQDGAYWYFLGADGAMKTGWVYTGGAWYYLKPTAGNLGAMQTGWIQTGGKWYYCNASGAMLSNTTVNGYKLGADGAWIK